MYKQLYRWKKTDKYGSEKQSKILTTNQQTRMYCVMNWFSKCTFQWLASSAIKKVKNNWHQQNMLQIFDMSQTQTYA